MLGLNIEIIIFSLFLAVNLGIGLFFSRSVNSLRDYAVGRKDFSTPTLAATIMVSWIGSWYVFETLQHTYNHGLYFIIVISGACICLMFVGALATRMREFLKNLSVAEAMGDLYGKVVQVITAVSGVFSVFAVVAIEFKVISKIISIIFATDSSWIHVLASAVVIIYAVSGGIRAITFTDLMQFVTFGTCIPILALVIWNHLPDPKQVTQLLNTHPNFNWTQVIRWHPKFIHALTIFLWFIIPAMDPVIFQRVSMARDVRQVRRAFNYAGLISLLACLFLAWIAILLLASDPNLKPNKLFEHIIHNYTSTGLRSFIGIGILALAMSTADSYLNASAILLTNDIAKPLGMRFKNEVRAAKLFCILSGIGALFVALQFRGIFPLLQFANRLYMPVVTVPLLMAIIGFRSTSLSVLVGMAVGLATVMLWSIFFSGDSIMPGIGANLLALLATHYIFRQPGGWTGIRKFQPTAEVPIEHLSVWARLRKSIPSFNLSRYLERALPNQEYLLSIFGIYVIAATYASFHTVPEEVQKQYGGLYHIICQSVLFISTGLLTYPLWPSIFKHKRFISWVWPIVVFYVLFGVGTWLILLSNFHIFQTMIFVLNIIMAFLLFDVSLVMVLLLLGGISAAYIFKIYAHLPYLPANLNNLGFKILYGLLLLSSFIALFKYQQSQKQLISRNAYLDMLQNKHAENLREALQHQERFMHTLTMDCVEGFKWLYQRSKILVEASEQVESLAKVKEILESGVMLLSKQQQAGEYLAKSVYRFKNYMHLEVQSIKIVKLLAGFLKSLDSGMLQPTPNIVLEQRIANKEIQCDPNKIQRMLFNTLRSIQEKNIENNPITLIIQDAYLVYDIDFIPNYSKKISAIQFIVSTLDPQLIRKNVPEDIQSIYLFLPKYIEELNKSEDEEIIDAHYGVFTSEQREEGITYFYTIPINLRQVRPVIMDEISV